MIRKEKMRNTNRKRKIVKVHNWGKLQAVTKRIRYVENKYCIAVMVLLRKDKCTL